MKLNVKLTGYKEYFKVLSAMESVLPTCTNNYLSGCATDFKYLFISNIMSQKHMSGYVPLNPRYRAWKEQYGKSGREFWVLFGDLVNAMSVFDHAGGKMAGIPAGVMDSGGKSWLGKGDKGESKPIAWYGSMMEYGRKSQSARPLFEPTTEEYYKSVQFANRQLEVLNKIGGVWHV